MCTITLFLFDEPDYVSVQDKCVILTLSLFLLNRNFPDKAGFISVTSKYIPEKTEENIIPSHRRYVPKTL